MKKILNLILFVAISLFAQNCKKDSDNPGINGGKLYEYKIVVNFEYGIDLSPTAYKNIYVTWLEGTTTDYIQNIYICQKLVTGGLTGIALPFWKINKFPAFSKSEIDAITSATMANTNFSVSTVLKDTSERKFVLLFEVDRSYDPNDWFTDQPALLYSAKIDLDESTSLYELLPSGWTPNENTQNVIQNTPMGKLQNEMRYITNHKEGSSFGVLDEHSATKMVRKITATIQRSVAK
jgi:hypothetical protein